MAQEYDATNCTGYDHVLLTIVTANELHSLVTGIGLVDACAIEAVTGI
jgi:hypothetical protein